MDSYTQGHFTSLCEAFIQDNLNMFSVRIVDFNVIVTRQALLESEPRNLSQGFRRTAEQGGKRLALNSVVISEYTSPEGNLIDPSDFHRYLRLLVNTRGGDFANELESTGVPYFRNISQVLTYSSAIKIQPSEDEPSGSNEQGLTDDTAAESNGMSSWAIVTVVIGATAVVVLVTIMIMRRIHAKRPTTTKTQQSPFSVVKLSGYLDLERSNLVDAPTYPSTTFDCDRFSTRGHSDLSASPRDEIDHFQTLEITRTCFDKEETSRNEPNHSLLRDSPVSPLKTEPNSLPAITAHPVEALGHASLTSDALSTLIETDKHFQRIVMDVVQFSQYSDSRVHVKMESIQEKVSVVATSDRRDKKRNTLKRETNRRGRKARKQTREASNNAVGAASTSSSTSRNKAIKIQPTIQCLGLLPYPSPAQPLNLTKNPIIIVQSSSCSVDHGSMSSISESDAEVD
jgi:hypothetical protein